MDIPRNVYNAYNTFDYNSDSDSDHVYLFSQTRMAQILAFR